jgi:hypothetical protein
VQSHMPCCCLHMYITHACCQSCVPVTHFDHTSAPHIQVPGVLMLLPIPVPSEDGDTDKYSMSAQP